MKIMQMIALNTVNTGTLVVLCEDGSLWKLFDGASFWCRLPEIRELTPQEEKELLERMTR